MTKQVADSKSTVPFKVTFADGSFTVVDAHSTYEAIQAGKNKSHLTPVNTSRVTSLEAEALEKQIYNRQ